MTAPSSLYPILSVDTEATWKHTEITFSAHCIYTQSDVTKRVLQAVKGLCITVSDFYTLFSHYLTVALKFTCKDEVAVARNKWICCFSDLSNSIQVLEEKGRLAVDDLEFLAIENERF